jgi:Ca2+-transporting ATPase
LTDEEVQASRDKFGQNKQIHKQQHKWWLALFDLFKEPMLLLLIAVAIIYFIMGQNSDLLYAGCNSCVSGISFIRTTGRIAMESLEKLNEPLSTGLAKWRTNKIPTAEIVIDDLIAQEGNTINADGEIIHSNDFSVNESLLTGEPMLFSNQKNGSEIHFSGTLGASGLAGLPSN